ncbi:hypothetical protein AND_000190 [Anopheles darlingi]|uniref:Uncharacterized protein n=1 Tax=Anopheles darlingi TaxID=43151 RepID=W5JWH3_ANODA|nr:hypothetical protein AND_000190 [Anopheles darlingi]
MAQQKFFSGLTEGMMNKGTAERPDRQKTHFYWPDDYAVEPSVSLQKQALTEGLLANNSNFPATINRQANETNDHNNERPQDRLHEHTGEINDQAVPHHHPKKITRSNMQIYNDVESIGKPIGKQQRVGINENQRIDQLLLHQSVCETGEAARNKRLSAMQSKIEFYDYIETATSTPSHHRCKRPSEKPTVKEAENGWVTTTTVPHGYMTDACTTFPTIDSYSQRSQSSSMHGGDDLEDGQSSYSGLNDCSARVSPSTTLPEHKRHSQRHLRSSINFHNGCTTADDSSAARKPLTVRDSATTRVGVGLPNL